MISKKAKFVLVFLPLFFVFLTLPVNAKEYYYNSIEVKIQINKDSTFDVEERQTFNYIGNFHVGWRSILLKKIDAISDIEIIDGMTGKPLIYSGKKLNELDPSNWGKFTYFKENGAENIEWYYNLADTKHLWIIKYKVHGGLGFFKDHDELYWNIFTDYDAPVLKSEAFVNLPPNNFSQKDFLTQLYSEAPGGSSKIIDNQNFYFSIGNISPHQAVTIAVGWPKGLISQAAYWKDFFKIYFGYFLSVFIILASVFAGFLYWYFTEKHKKGRGVIIPQYEPPQNLRPAMAEVIIREKITSKAWPATIVDLAARGYVKIKEDPPHWRDVLGRILTAVLILLFFGFFLWGYLATRSIAGSIMLIMGILFFAFVSPSIIKMFVAQGNLKKFFLPKNYIIEKLKLFEDDANLENYEKEFLKIIFRGKNYFSTKELKQADSLVKIDFSESFKTLKKKLYKEAELDTKVFEIGPSMELKRKNIITFAVIGIFILLWLLDILGLDILAGFWSKILGFSGQFNVLLLSIVISAVGLFSFIKYETRLSKEGVILKEDWLGFKLYLETAEKYRLQNLTPETFEKYLPYAMIFGVEKKWAKAFEILNIQLSSPTWYVGVGGAIGINGFSASNFASSFSASFSSAFGSATGTGGAGGAGGGGGGGGGGAR